MTTRDEVLQLYNSVRTRLFTADQIKAVEIITETVRANRLDLAYNQLRALVLHVEHGYPVYLGSRTAPNYRWLDGAEQGELQESYLELHDEVGRCGLSKSQFAVLHQATRFSMRSVHWQKTAYLLLHGLVAHLLHQEPTPEPLLETSPLLPPAVADREDETKRRDQENTEAGTKLLRYLNYIREQSFTYWVAGRFLNHLKR